MDNLQKSVEVREVVIARLTRRGNGKDDPIRIITEVWDKETGEKIAERDPVKQNKTNE